MDVQQFAQLILRFFQFNRKRLPPGCFAHSFKSMKISTSALGLVAIAASPFLFFELLVNEKSNTSLSGVCDLIYMTGWMCTIIALLRLNATGFSNKSKIILYVQLGTLTVAQIWNVWTIADPQNANTLYFILDFFWPISNITLLIVGIVIAVKRVLPGRKRFAVLIAGLWLPFTIITSMLTGPGTTNIIISGMYSTIAWFGMGHMVWKSAAVRRGVVEARVRR
jgi:hypothetical protein